MARIELDRVSLTFRVRKQQGRMTLKEYVVRGLFLRPDVPMMDVRALQDVSLTISAGNRVGILGHNGAGKSTLLKLLAGIYEPTKGRRRVRGRISSMFELTLGFEQEATGWENIRYRGYLQGEGRLEASAERSIRLPSSPNWAISSTCRSATTPRACWCGWRLPSPPPSSRRSC